MSFTVLSSDPVRRGVLLCWEQLSFLRRETMYLRNLNSSGQECRRKDFPSLGNEAWLGKQLVSSALEQMGGCPLNSEVLK